MLQPATQLILAIYFHLIELLLAPHLQPEGYFFGHGDSGELNRIQYITIASTGNAIDFGDLTVGRYYLSASSSATRSVIGGGRNSSNVAVNTIDYVTISSTGNATDFGDLTTIQQDGGSASGAGVAVFAGGRRTGNTTSNIIDYVNIATTGNATDWGDLVSAAAYGVSGLSNAHGGL